MPLFRFVEINAYSALMAEVEGEARPKLVRRLEEFVSDGKLTGAELFARDLVPDGIDGAATVVGTVRLPGRGYHLSSTTEAEGQSDRAGIEAFALSQSIVEAGSEIVAVRSEGGEVVLGRKGSRWLLASLGSSRLDSLAAAFEGRPSSLARLEPAGVSLMGALSQGFKRDGASKVALVWDLADIDSYLFLVDAGGVKAAAKLGWGIEKIVEIVQTELRLRFKGAAAKLFFKPDYDFTDAGPRITAKVQELLRVEVEGLQKSASLKAGAWVVAGLPSSQAWLTGALGQGMGLTSLGAEAVTWTESLGLKFADENTARGIAPGWLGLLHTVAMVNPAVPEQVSAWHPAWRPKVTVTAPEPAAEPAPKPAAPAPVVQPLPKAKEEKPVVAEKPAPAPKPVEKPAEKPAPKPAAAKPSSPAEKPAAVAPTPAAKAAPVPEPARKAPEPFLKKNMGIIIAALLALALIGAGLVYMNIKDAEEQERLLRKATEKKAAEETAKRKAAEDKALHAVEAERDRLLAEQRQREEALAVEKAELERTRREMERQAKASGSLKLNTQPEGALVGVDDRREVPAPINLSGLKPGKHTLRITLQGYEPVLREIEVADGETTDLGLIRLTQLTGNLEVNSNPPGLSYTLQYAAAGPISVGPAFSEGKTPAKISSIPVGQYRLTVSRPGWGDYVRSFEVLKGRTAKIEAVFAASTVTIESAPTGATVEQDGIPLGYTPLTLQEVNPGAVSYQLSMDGYFSASVTGTVEGGKTLALSATLQREDEVMPVAKADVQPQPLSQAQPTFGDLDRPRGVTLEFSLVLDREGNVKDVRHLKGNASAPVIDRCIAAIRKWKYRPALLRGQPVAVRFNQALYLP